MQRPRPPSSAPRFVRSTAAGEAFLPRTPGNQTCQLAPGHTLSWDSTGLGPLLCLEATLLPQGGRLRSAAALLPAACSGAQTGEGLQPTGCFALPGSCRGAAQSRRSWKRTGVPGGGARGTGPGQSCPAVVQERCRPQPESCSAALTTLGVSLPLQASVFSSRNRARGYLPLQYLGGSEESGAWPSGGFPGGSRCSCC